MYLCVSLAPVCSPTIFLCGFLILSMYHVLNRVLICSPLQSPPVPVHYAYGEISGETPCESRMQQEPSPLVYNWKSTTFLRRVLLNDEKFSSFRRLNHTKMNPV